MNLEKLHIAKTTSSSTSDYIGPIQYENTKLAFIMLPDGRAVKTGTGWNHEYFHKDHLGNNSTYTSYQFGFKTISGLALNSFEKLALNITIPASYDNGYLYTYVTNESNVPTASSVYFDDVSVRHWQTTQALQVTQVTEYYPFGLAINPLAYSRNSVNKNDYLYNGKELQDDFGLGWMDYGARMYDPALGRWSSVDPMAEKMRRHSPYNYAFDNPVIFIDPDGMAPYTDLNFLDWMAENKSMDEALQMEENNKAGMPGSGGESANGGRGNEEQQAEDVSSYEDGEGDPTPTYTIFLSDQLHIFREQIVLPSANTYVENFVIFQFSKNNEVEATASFTKITQFKGANSTTKLIPYSPSEKMAEVIDYHYNGGPSSLEQFIEYSLRGNNKSSNWLHDIIYGEGTNPDLPKKDRLKASSTSSERHHESGKTKPKPKKGKDKTTRR